MNEEKPPALQFPCLYPIKIVGKNNDQFEILAISIIKKHVPNLSENAISNRLSKNGTYRAMTVTIEATSQEQLDAIYRELSQEELVIMAL